MKDDLYGDLLDHDDTSGLAIVEIVSDLLDDDQDAAQLVGEKFGDDIQRAALARKRRAKIQAKVRDLLRPCVEAGALLRPFSPRSSREYALGLGSTSIAGNSSANIRVQPQIAFRPERLVIPSNLAPDFLVTNLIPTSPACICLPQLSEKSLRIFRLRVTGSDSLP